MLSLYLNSLYQLVTQQNPFLQMGQNMVRTLLAVRNIRRNLKRAKSRLMIMNQRIDRVEAYINEGPQHQHGFDLTR